MNAPSHPRSPHEPAGVLPVLIRCIRDQHVILDADLAALYGVPTRRLNEQVKRNAARFPTDFLFRLTAEEWACARSREAVSSWEDAGENRIGRTRRKMRPVPRSTVTLVFCRSLSPIGFHVKEAAVPYRTPRPRR